MMYICDECDAVFEEPVRKREYSEEYGDSIAYYCPHCGSEEYTADECPSCHGAKNAQDPVCHKCKLRVKGLLRLFVSDFNRAEREYLADLLDGATLDNIAKGERI
nr:MAG TPA: putative cytoplasmic protein [Caudoviricetes sp.]